MDVVIASKAGDLEMHAIARGGLTECVAFLLLLMPGGTTLMSQAGSPGQPSEVAVNPKSTIRGSSFLVTVLNAPPNPKTVVVALDGQMLKAEIVTPGTYRAYVSDKVDQASPDFVPLGTHRVAVQLDQQWFTSDQTVTIQPQVLPELLAVSPAAVVRGSSEAQLVLTGRHFATKPADDNQIALDGVALPVKWDGCDPASPWTNEAARITHGSAQPDTITLCNLILPDKPSVELTVGQGIAQPSGLRLAISPLRRMWIVGLSVLGELACALLVIVLASFIRKLSIGNSKYGLFRILFLDTETDTFSLSKLQFYLWTGAAIFAYNYFVISRMFVQQLGLPDVPSSLPGIIAVGAGTAIGSQVVTGVRGPKGGGPEKPSLADFVTSGGVAAPDRVQMLLWTIVGVTVFCLATLRTAPWDIKELPQIGSNLMLLMGLSSAGYLGGKLARKPGPVLNEISITPGGPDDNQGGGPGDTSAAPDLSQPIAAAEQVWRQAQAVIAQASASLSSTALSAAQDSVKALRGGIDAAKAGNSGVLSTLADGATAADVASRILASEFRQLASTGSAQQVEATRQLAELAQECASAAQDLSSGAAQATGSAQAQQASADSSAPALRVIDLRGRNLSLDATFEINDAELPFRMLAPVNGVRGPERVAPEDDSSLANMCRELRLRIAPATLGDSDRASYDAWFQSAGKPIKVTITNPDGQMSELSFDVPPGSTQSHS